MENNVREFLRKIKNTAVEAGQSAGKTGKDLLDQAKLGVQLAKLNNDVDAQYYEIGKSLYQMHKGEETADEAIDDMLMTLDGLFEQIEDTKAKIASYSKAAHVCPSCGNNVKKNHVFCPFCGYKLVEDEPAEETVVDAEAVVCEEVKEEENND